MGIYRVIRHHNRAIFALALLSILAGYSALQAMRIHELQALIAMQQTNMALLQAKPNQTKCPVPAESHVNIIPTTAAVDFSKRILHSLSAAAIDPVPEDASENNVATTPENPDAPSTQDIRELFNDVLGEKTSLSYSDADLLRDGPDLLTRQIENTDVDFDTTLTAAYGLNDLTGTAIPEHLSEALLRRAELSDNRDDLHEALILIAEQRYPHTSQLAAELVNSADKDSRMVGVYLLATDRDSDSAVPTLLNHLYTYPDETIGLIEQWVGE